MENNLESYNFALPPELIANEALKDRESCRLMYLGQNDAKPTHDTFKNIGAYLRDSDVLVLNNTKVMRSRVYACDPKGKKVEILLIKALSNTRWQAMIFGQYPVGSILNLASLEGFYNIKIVSDSEIESDADLSPYIENYGEVPIPPYFKRKAKASDTHDYQTVYAKHLGSIAAPTAGLHFTKELLEQLKQRGILIAETTLHVGPGTFLPIRCQNIEDHKMHAESFVMDEECADILNHAKEKKRRIITVGSTATRVVEQVMQLAWAQKSNKFFACAGETSIYIKPGVKFLGCDGIITNFHMPKSTLFLLVSAAVGRERVLASYEEAIDKKYRFYSYGDACFFEVKNSNTL